MVKRGCFLEQEDWHSLFWGLSKDLDAGSLEILWWILIARNHPKLARTLSYSPPENTDLPIKGSEPTFGSVILTTSMANALLRVRSFTRGEFDSLVASDALAVAKARMTLEHMVILGIPRDESSYLNIISASHYHLRSDKAFLESINKILDELMAPDIQVKLTTDHCNRILACLHQRGLFKMAKALYQDLRNDPARSPNIESLNHILHVLIDSPEDENIFDFYRQELERWNLKPDIVTLNILLEAQIQFGEVQGISPLLQEFRKNHFILPDKIAYTHIIRGFVSVGELQTAETYLKEYIDRQDIALAADPFHHLMRGYNERAQYDLLMDAYSVLIYAEIRIPMKIWRTLLISCIRQPNPAESIRLFVVSWQKAHLGKWSMLLLEMVVETHIKACVEIDPIVAMVKDSKLDSKTQHLALLTITSIYPKLARRPLPNYILEQLKPHVK
ncbi:hypothetical protein DSO57_1031827 [Entomophthora muscae]|uniref:Uncharacterized protein n=1 Tax=Entomophthora muscae TaxID=34485 RepID=A0ACC2UKL6_9FUNG|nr:hypothetical protein DSO57_1031827 [Entomophthora muscae]